MLTDVQWLADPRNAEKVRIVDMRSADAYKAGHIPGAVLLDAGALRLEAGMGPAIAQG
jgi:3-mercaptopyruvate sulfurtransferase SseA